MKQKYEKQTIKSQVQYTRPFRAHSQSQCIVIHNHLSNLSKVDCSEKMLSMVAMFRANLHGDGSGESHWLDFQFHFINHVCILLPPQEIFFVLIML